MLFFNGLFALGMLLFFNNAVIACQDPEEIKARDKQDVNRWPHLALAPFKERHQYVTDFVEECDTVIEIGGNGTPADTYLQGKTVIVIDPRIRGKTRDTVMHVRKTFQDWKDPVTSTNYAVVILGLELAMNPDGWKKLYELIDGSKKTLIEFSQQNKEAKKMMKDILASVNKQSTQQELDLSSAFAKKEKHVFPYRMLYFLQ